MYLVGLHIYCKMIHGPYSTKLLEFIEVYTAMYVTTELKIYIGLSQIVSNLFCILIFRTDVLCVYPMPFLLEVSVL